jgi:hypothetical protein
MRCTGLLNAGCDHVGRRSGEWWTPDHWDRDEWDLVLTAQEEFKVLVKVYRNLFNGEWYVEGEYDLSERHPGQDQGGLEIVMKVTTSLRLHIALFSDEVPLSGQSQRVEEDRSDLGYGIDVHPIVGLQMAAKLSISVSAT